MASFLLVLFTVHGSDGNNRFGQPPQPASAMVKSVAIVFLCLLTLVVANFLVHEWKHLVPLFGLDVLL